MRNALDHYTSIYKKENIDKCSQKRNTIIDVHVSDNKNQTNAICDAKEVFLKEMTQVVKIH